MSGRSLCGNPVNTLSCPHAHAILTHDNRTQETEEVVLPSLRRGESGGWGGQRQGKEVSGMLSGAILTLQCCPQPWTCSCLAFDFPLYMEQKDSVPGNGAIRGKNAL